ncbi:MAG: GNAT family N-acetyltransferase [Solirubrobacteraceae bacterium]|nr:GNAT family N-acetyltransferase [Solirubrobacteraceae bacterium]
MRDLRLREATAADAPELAAILAEGLETYRSFAPEGWEPGPIAEAERLGELTTGGVGYRACVGEDDQGAVGFAGYLPATLHRSVAVDDPELAHLRHLFVRERGWGTGLATRLDAWAAEDAAARGFTRMRLFCVAPQARARAFYERAGWTTDGIEQDAPTLGMPVVEYRRALR